VPIKNLIPNTKSIAVLPFVNRSTDPENEYFSDGITEEIINALTSIKGLRVIARTSSFAFKNKNIDVRTIGKQLGVSTVLEGSVRKIKNRVRITAQLIDTNDGMHLWSKNFDRELQDIFALQDEISLLIAEQIRENFGHFDIKEQLIEAPTQNVEAYNLYLKARYHHLKWNPKDLIQGVSYYKESIEQDPTFALPYFGAGLCYGINASWKFIPTVTGLKSAEAYLKAGFELDNTSYLCYFAQATVSLWGKWDFKKGYQYLQQSMQINPAATDAEEGLAELYTAIGQFEKAMGHTQNILTINPLSPNHYYTKGNIYYLSKNFLKAIENMEKALQIDPQFALAIEIIAACYIQLKDYEQLDRFLDAHPLAEKPNECRALYKLMYPDETLSVDMESIRLRLSQSTLTYLIPWHLYLHIYLNNHELALDILTTGIKERQGQYINFQNDPFLTPLHSYKQFQQLISEIHHPSRLPITIPKSSKTLNNIKSILNQEEANNYLDIINDLLENQQLHLDASLCLRTLAQKIELHPNKLSWLINEHTSKNFNEYINSFRIASFKQKALDPANQHLTLLGLAYESGFNSKTAFNTFFKKTEGMTPRAWVKLNTK
jgi:TolB-like protein/AraC-like DNA-binding protein